MARSVVVLRVGDRFFGVDVAQAVTVLGVTPTTPLPRSKPYMKGVINLRGLILPVLDLAERLGGPANEAARRVIVVDTGSTTAGLLVDDVLEVAEAVDEAETADHTFISADSLIGSVARVRLTHWREEPQEALLLNLNLDALAEAA